MKFTNYLTTQKGFTYSQKGFTYIELILYIGIVTIVLNTLVPFAWNIINISTKSSTQQEVYNASRYISERMKKEIRDASSVTTCDATTLTLVNSDSAKNPTTFSFSSNQLTITQGTLVPTPVKLHSNSSQVSSFNCLNYSGTTTDNVQINFTVTDNIDSTRQEYSEILEMQFATETRN